MLRRRRRSPELVVALLLATTTVVRAQPPPSTVPTEPPAADAKPGAAEAKPDAGANGDQPTFFGFGNGTKSKEPITITSDTLEYEYKDGVIVYRGDVLAVQGETKVKSNELRITLAKTDDEKNGKKRSGSDAVGALDDGSASKLQEVVAIGSVRIDQGTRWAVGGKATFDQSN